jgi:hypothetical protein
MPQFRFLLQEKRQESEGVERERNRARRYRNNLKKKLYNTKIWGITKLNKVWKDRNDVKRHVNKVNRQENNKTNRVIKGE